MKRILAVVLALCLLLCACGESAAESALTATPEQQASPETVRIMSADDLARAVIGLLGEDVSAMENINSRYDAAALEGFVEGYYGLYSEGYEDCAIYRKGGTEAFEISIFRLSEQADIDSAEKCLENYRHSRQGDFFGYEPEQAEIVENSIVCTYAGYAAVLICENSKNARAALEAAVDGTEFVSKTDEEEESTWADGVKLTDEWKEFDPPGIDDMSIWDSSALVAAVKSGSDKGLDMNEKKLYTATVEVLQEIISEGMTELEKEWAVYSWLTLNCDYDDRHYYIPNAAPRESYEPYGAIVEGTAVCLGYATAFQFFMDILDIECITVVGAAFNSHEDHAWNMVRIDDVWYCVDATWDSSNGIAQENCLYFNVSSEWMALTDHQWDYENVPMAVSPEDGSYQLYVPVS